MDILLMGNPNSGKTTLFNRLTGMRHHVGNFPGITVEHAEGRYLLDPSIRIIDVPGMYSLTALSAEEKVSLDLLRASPPDAILCAVDATCPARGLYLVLQLKETGLPIAICLTMMDEVRQGGGIVDIDALSAALAAPVVSAWGAKPDALIHAAKRARRTSAVSRNSIAARYAEVDRICRLAFHLPAVEISGEIPSWRDIFEFAPYDESAAQRRSTRIDSIATHRVLAFPLFLLVMAGIFFVSFGPVGETLRRAAAALIAAFTGVAHDCMTALGAAQWLTSLVCEGVLSGLSLVLSFIPTVALLFLLLSILEDSGYMARMSFCTDALLRSIGLSGRAVVPLLIGFGCSVPAIMATRALPTRRDRFLTILFVPFLSCSAKIPIYSLLATAFFPGKHLPVIMGLYCFGIAVGTAAMAALGRIAGGKGPPYLLELPAYRVPSVRSVLSRVWMHIEKFLRSALTILLLSTIAIWALQRVDFSLAPVSDSNRSILAGLGRALSPAFIPLGFSDWRAVAALISGLLAKENVLSTLGVLLGASGESALSFSLNLFLSPLSALSFLVFVLLYMPCIAAFAAARRELGGARYAALAALFQTGVAWVCACAVYNIGSFLARAWP